MDFLVAPKVICEWGSRSLHAHNVSAWELSLPLSDKGSADSLTRPVLITSCQIKSPMGFSSPSESLFTTLRRLIQKRKWKRLTCEAKMEGQRVEGMDGQPCRFHWVRFSILKIFYVLPNSQYPFISFFFLKKKSTTAALYLQCIQCQQRAPQSI